MLTKAEQKVFWLFAKHPHMRFGINEAARTVNVAVSRVFTILKKYELEGGAFKKQKVANSTLYSLNLENEKTRKLLEFLSVEARDAFFRRNIKAKLIFSDLLAANKKEGLFDAVILFGSFARQEPAPGDADVLFVTDEHKAAMDAIEALRPQIRRMHQMDIHPIIMSGVEFVKNFRNKKDVIPSIFREGVVITGAGAYWTLVSECVRRMEYSNGRQ